MQYYLPDEKVINKDFLKAVLAGQKQLLKKVDVLTIEVPRYDELSVKNIYPQFKKDPIIMSYFPDHYPANKGPPRDYFFNILNSLQPEYVSELLSYANKQRHSAEGEAMKNETIKISQFWAEELASMPYLSSKCLTFIHSNSSISFCRKTWKDTPFVEGQQQASGC